MATTTWYLGPAGALVALPPPGRDIARPRPKRVATHELLGGGSVIDRWGGRRRYVLRWEALTADELSTIETLFELPGPYVLLDPGRRNLLTTNQSTGTDALRSTEGVVARFQGVVTSGTDQFRSGTRSIKYDSTTALAATGRGPYLYTSVSTVDATWAPVRPGVSYTLTAYARASVAVSFQAIFDWHNAAGTYLSTSLGSSTAVGTSDWNTRLTVTAAMPAGAAYGIGAFVNTTTTGAQTFVWFDDVQVEENSVASVWALGTGVPRVSLVEQDATSPQSGWENFELVAQEL